MVTDTNSQGTGALPVSSDSQGSVPASQPEIVGTSSYQPRQPSDSHETSGQVVCIFFFF